MNSFTNNSSTNGNNSNTEMINSLYHNPTDEFYNAQSPHQITNVFSANPAQITSSPFVEPAQVHSPTPASIEISSLLPQEIAINNAVDIVANNHSGKEDPSLIGLGLLKVNQGNQLSMITNTPPTTLCSAPAAIRYIPVAESVQPLILPATNMQIISPSSPIVTATASGDPIAMHQQITDNQKSMDQQRDEIILNQAIALQAAHQHIMLLNHVVKTEVEQQQQPSPKTTSQSATANPVEMEEIEKQQEAIEKTLQDISNTCESPYLMNEDSEKILRDVQKVQNLVQQQAISIEKILGPTEGNSATEAITTPTLESRNLLLHELQGLSREELIKKCLEYDKHIKALEKQTRERGETLATRKRCLWFGCSHLSESADKLHEHLVNDHLKIECTSEYICKWENCTRNQVPFRKKARMVSHLTIHTGEKKFECPVDGCLKKFSRKDALNIHLTTHTGFKPYKCNAPDCFKSFYHLRSYKRHLRTHN